jgi:hypothetical protein
MVYIVQGGVEILTSKICHENGDKFKNGLSKKGVEFFLLSIDTNKSIANFRETIPLIKAFQSAENTNRKFLQLDFNSYSHCSIMLKQDLEFLSTDA